jgi:hypothetical protein
MAMAVIELTPGIIPSLASRCKNDRRLAEAIARELFLQSEPIRIVKLVLDKEKALSMLVDCVQEDLGYVVNYLNGKRGLKRKRSQVSYERIMDIKDNICRFLKYHPGSGKHEILVAVTTCGVFYRVMDELIEFGKVKRVGDRRNGRYYLHGNGKSS